MVVSYQWHASTALVFEKVAIVSIKWEAWWAQELVWMSFGTDKSFAQTGKWMILHMPCPLPSNYTKWANLAHLLTSVEKDIKRNWNFFMQTVARLTNLGKCMSILWGLNISHKGGQIQTLLGFWRNKVPFWNSVFVVICIESSCVKLCLKNMLLDRTLNGTSLPCGSVMIFKQHQPRYRMISHVEIYTMTVTWIVHTFMKVMFQKKL
jgi:hypothetical protein